jgi:hypothetical protein
VRDIALCKPNNTMDMVRHDHEFVGTHGYVRTDSGCSEPFISNDFADLVQVHLTVVHPAKEGDASVRANGDEVRACFSVIPPW